ncbi:MAG: helix-turn-helix domain-containing protein [Chloroflexota bacterium]
MDKLLLSIPEALQITGLGRSKFLELVYQGRIASVLVGRRRFIRPDALRAFVNSLQAEQEVHGDGRS